MLYFQNICGVDTPGPTPREGSLLSHPRPRPHDRSASASGAGTMTQMLVPLGLRKPAISPIFNIHSTFLSHAVCRKETIGPNRLEEADTHSGGAKGGGVRGHGPPFEFHRHEAKCFLWITKLQ